MTSQSGSSSSPGVTTSALQRRFALNRSGRDVNRLLLDTLQSGLSKVVDRLFHSFAAGRYSRSGTRRGAGVSRAAARRKRTRTTASVTKTTTMRRKKMGDEGMLDHARWARCGLLDSLRREAGWAGSAPLRCPQITWIKSSLRSSRARVSRVARVIAKSETRQ